MGKLERIFRDNDLVRKMEDLYTRCPRNVPVNLRELIRYIITSDFYR